MASIRGEKFGQLSNADIIYELKKQNVIITPLYSKTGDHSQGKIKGASFDISPSCLIMSVKRGRFVRIYSDISFCKKGYRNPAWHCASCRKKAAFPSGKQCTEQKYIYISPRDTVLVLSKEYIQLPSNICGNVYSRVSTVSSGLGHISTTIDPLWRGALLIAISNPSSEPIKLVIEDETATSIPLATVTLQYLNTQASSTGVPTSHLPARVDILEKYMFSTQECKSRFLLTKNYISHLLRMKDYDLTVNLINALKKLEHVKPAQWKTELSNLESMVYAQKIVHRKWQTRVLSILRWMQKALLILFVAFITILLYQVYSGDTVSIQSIVLPICIALFEGIFGLILSSKG